MKERLNQVLRSTTGYQVQRPLPPELRPERLQGEVARLQRQVTKLRKRSQEAAEANAALQDDLAAERTTARKAVARRDRLKRQVARMKERAEEQEEARRAKERADFDDRALKIIDLVAERTMTPPLRVFGLVEAVRYVQRAGVPGAIVECGVWRGGSMQAVAWALQGEGATDRDLHLYDTYEGMTPPTEEDVRSRDGRSAAELLEESSMEARVWAFATLEDVQEGMRETGYPEERLHYHVGPVEETIPGEAPEQIALLRLDTDWYASTKHELEQLYHRIAPGGVLVLDDYGDWEGARRATDEFLETLDAPILLMPLSGGRIAVTPG
ncbi:TylF/MycF family methyltransferase [Nocardioides rotundus]|uniref:TylF/MycF/NovP-related O-methyltransferase n=1 Tax=Nocardioides rotundus TaxID=1774216 RepID=UPI001CBE6F4D|nr:TylF/MycF/NovP-related O-methyltransferase [Nocardioides rotundus]UAL28668.1 TylF/MycF family methyltransferase [Nocardioides rotundus]